jgi:hypothetical protein
MTDEIKPGESKLVGTAFYTTKPFPKTEFVAASVIFEGEITAFCVTNVIPPIVPEPNTLALLGMGLVPMAGMIRRKRISR